MNSEMYYQLITTNSSIFDSGLASGHVKKHAAYTQTYSQSVE